MFALFGVCFNYIKKVMLVINHGGLVEICCIGAASFNLRCFAMRLWMPMLYFSIGTSPHYFNRNFGITFVKCQKHEQHFLKTLRHCIQGETSCSIRAGYGRGICSSAALSRLGDLPPAFSVCRGGVCCFSGRTARHKDTQTISSPKPSVNLVLIKLPKVKFSSRLY